MAFQPIVDLFSCAVYAYEALVRGPGGEGAPSVLAQVSEANRYAFDQQCRVKAIETAAKAGLTETAARLSINFLPNAVYSPAACIQLTLKTAKTVAFPTDRLIFEFTENEEMVDPSHVANIVASYQKMGFGTALDDFGAGHAGLNLLARFQPDIIKLDMDLVRGLDCSLPRRIIVAAVVRMCDTLGVTVIAEGIETVGELDALRAIGVRYVQGYYFAKPLFETLPPVMFGWGGARHAA
ncbi:EAL domain-containing protein [Sphingomonas koreensis]|nr:EAL domain-containing protein [Sphingomonas koreensis]